MFTNGQVILPIETGLMRRFSITTKQKFRDLSLQGVVTLNNIRFHKSKTGFNFYGFAGIGGSVYETKVNALDGSTKYNFNSINEAAYKNRKDFIKNMKNNVLDDSFETPAENPG